MTIRVMEVVHGQCELLNVVLLVRPFGRHTPAAIGGNSSGFSMMVVNNDEGITVDSVSTLPLSDDFSPPTICWRDG